MELWLATGNKGKVTELKKFLSSLSFEVRSQKELHYFSPPLKTDKALKIMPVSRPKLSML